MSLVQLESFVAVAEEGHVGRAARRLHVTQPPLSRRILALEDDLGVKLFERTPGGMRLSSAGEELLERARAILAQVASARDAMLRRREFHGANGSTGCIRGARAVDER